MARHRHVNERKLTAELKKQGWQFDSLRVSMNGHYVFLTIGGRELMYKLRYSRLRRAHVLS